MESRKIVLGSIIYGAAAFGDGFAALLHDGDDAGDLFIAQPVSSMHVNFDEDAEARRVVISEQLTRNFSFTTTLATINTFAAARLNSDPPFAPMVDLAITSALPAAWTNPCKANEWRSMLQLFGSTVSTHGAIESTTRTAPWLGSRAAPNPAESQV